jgi:hypothetical protein
VRFSVPKVVLSGPVCMWMHDCEVIAVRETKPYLVSGVGKLRRAA